MSNSAEKMGMKLTKRKGFNFFRSYYDVYNELNDKDKLSFMNALLNKQFLNIDPSLDPTVGGSLGGMAKFAYLSQLHNIESQVKGFETKTGISLKIEGASVGASVGGSQAPPVQGEGKGEGEGIAGSVQREEKEKEEFSRLYDSYHQISGKLKSDKASCEREWKKLSNLDKSLAWTQHKAWVDAQLKEYKNHRYVKKMYKYLQEKRWEDLTEKAVDEARDYHKERIEDLEFLIKNPSTNSKLRSTYERELKSLTT